MGSACWLVGQPVAAMSIHVLKDMKQEDQIPWKDGIFTLCLESMH